MSDPEPSCDTANGRRDWRALRASAGLIAVSSHCRLCYADEEPEAGDLVVRAANGCIHKPASEDLQPRNVPRIDGGEA